MKKILNNKKFIISLILVITIIIVLLAYLLIFNDTTIKESSIKNDYYAVAYDTTWKVKESSNTRLLLEHSTSSSLDINIISLDNDSANSDIDLLIEDVIYSIEKQNRDYKLLSSKKVTITNNDYEAYKYLYENNDMQSMIIIGKVAEKLFIINYCASDEYFDILLDSSQAIINSFKLLNKEIKLTVNAIDIKEEEISFNSSNDTCNYKDVAEYDIYNNHYNVKYSIPKCFALLDFDSVYGSFRETFDTGYISIRTNVVYRNIYEYLTDDTAFGTLAANIKSLKENYNDVVVQNEKLSNGKEGYIYKINYDYDLDTTILKYEQIYLVYYVDYLRTFVIELDAKDTNISKNLVDNIKINSYTKYGKNIEKMYNNDKLTGTMKVLANKDYYYSVSYSIPSKYEEQDYSNNMFATRYFGLNKNEKTDNYEYNANISLYKSKTKEQYIESIKKDYSSKTLYKEYKLEYVKELTSNNNKFSCYNLKYTTSSGTFNNEDLLLLAVWDSLYVVDINSNKKDSSMDIINDLLTVTVNKVDIK